MRKMLCLLLAIMAVLSLIAGCSKEPSNKTEVGTITIGVPKNLTVSDYNDNAVTHYLEEKTGYDLHFVEFETAQQDYKTQIATKIITPGEELPDILLGFNLGDDLRHSYADQGILVDLKPYYDDKELAAPFWKGFNEGRLTEETKIWFYAMVENPNNGGWYSVPGIPFSEWDTLSYQPWINQEWLDKLKLPVPTNLDELLTTLRAFKNDDFDGNPDTIQFPLLGCNNNFGGRVFEWLANMKMYYNRHTFVTWDDKGKLISTFTSDEYRDALKWVKSLIDEGLIAKESITLTLAQQKTYLNNPDITVGVGLFHPTTANQSAEAMAQKWTPLDIFGYVIPQMVKPNFTNFVTKWADDPRACFEVLMAMCDQEFAVRARYGLEGTHWEYAKEGELSMKGTQAFMSLITDIASETQSKVHLPGISIGCSGILSMDDVVASTNTTTAVYKQDMKILTMIRNSWKAKNEKTPSYLPAVTLRWTQEQKDDCPERGDVQGLFNTWQTQFLTGAKYNVNNDAHWQKYLDELNAAGLQNYLKVTQECITSMVDRGYIKLP